MLSEVDIPYFDLTRQFASYQEAWLNEIARLGEQGNFILGDAIHEIEAELAEFLDVQHAITVASGTDAIVLALKAAGVGPGDAVIVPNFTFYASVEAVSLVGATPRLVDIDLSDFNMKPVHVRAAIDEHVKAIIPVHLFGLPAQLPEILAIGKTNDIPVIEDAAQAFGSQINHRYCGTLGDYGCFSFYPTKILGAYGDGGMITTNSAESAEQLKLLRNHGAVVANRHQLIGCTSRLDTVQAAILRLKLKTVHAAIQRRRELAARYRQQLPTDVIVLPTDRSARWHVFNIFTIRVLDRRRLAAALKSANIGYQIYYPIPIHRQLPYQNLGYSDDDFPNSVRASSEVISLPLYPEMKDTDVDQVCAIVRDTLV